MICEKFHSTDQSIDHPPGRLGFFAFGCTLLPIIPAPRAPTPRALLAVGAVSPSDIQEETKRAQAILDEQAELLDPELSHTREVVAAESVVTDITTYAEENDVGLIALSTHGRSGLRRLVLGSIAELVLRHSHVPVLCFPPPK